MIHSYPIENCISVKGYNNCHLKFLMLHLKEMLHDDAMISNDHCKLQRRCHTFASCNVKHAENCHFEVLATPRRKNYVEVLRERSAFCDWLFINKQIANDMSDVASLRNRSCDYNQQLLHEPALDMRWQIDLTNEVRSDEFSMILSCPTSASRIVILPRIVHI